MNWAPHLRISGALLIALALSHLWFPRRFAWATELSALSLLNRQIFLVHSFFIALFVFLNSVLFTGYTGLLLEPGPLRDVVLTGIAVFWLCRLLVQSFVYDRRLWRGNRLNTMVHFALTAFWAYLVVIPVGVIFAG
jgi:hypothetical protein